MDQFAEPRIAGVRDADEVARLLHDFNTEFDTESPGTGVLAARLERLLADQVTVAVLVGAPAVGVALVTIRPNVWYDGSVALLDELYIEPVWRNRGLGTTLLAFTTLACRDRGVDLIEINVDEGDVDAQRFYERHQFSGVETSTGERAFYYFKELDP
jgi:GNAT superfamily N-acetyltransferase